MRERKGQVHRMQEVRNLCVRTRHHPHMHAHARVHTRALAQTGKDRGCGSGVRAEWEPHKRSGGTRREEQHGRRGIACFSSRLGWKLSTGVSFCELPHLEVTCPAAGAAWRPEGGARLFF